MADKTSIEWTRGDDGTPGATWNPSTGCDKVSPGCDHCYAMTLAPRLKAMGSPRYQTDGDPATSGPGFGFAMHPGALDQPLRWTKPRRIFVNSMSDLFHSSMAEDFLVQVWAVMSLAPQHTFQILTKRPGRMASILGSPGWEPMVRDCARDMKYGDGRSNRMNDQNYQTWPLPNVHLGTSVEDQKRAELRIPALRRTPAAVRFLSMEPLLDYTHLGQHLDVQVDQDGDRWTSGDIGWVIVGGESGPGARPMHADWVRSLRDECVAAGVPFHFKQWGSHDEHGTPMHKKLAGRMLDGRTWDEFPA